MSGAVDLQFPPGFRFHPTDEELVTHYLCRKCASLPIAVPIIADVDLYKHDPWQLPGLASCGGEKEWYFFSPRDRKYPNGSRPNRAAGSGYWKATGADKPIGSPKPMAIKKALVFYVGKAPKGEKSDWIMHEYRLAGVDRSAARRKNNLRLDDWVLCRIYNKKGSLGKQIKPEERTTAEMRSVLPPPTAVPDSKPPITSHVHAAAPGSHVPQMMDLLYLDSSDSMPRLHADSSCSEHVLSPEFAACEREVQSQPRWREWERALGIDSAAGGSGELPQFGGGEILSTGFRDPLQDIFMCLQKPF